MSRYLPIINGSTGAVLWNSGNGLPEVMPLDIARSVLEMLRDLASKPGTWQGCHRNRADELQEAITAAEGVPCLSTTQRAA